MSPAMSPDDKLKELGITLTPPPEPLGSYLPAVRTGNLIFLSGVLPLKDGHLIKTGRVGAELTVEEAQEAARLSVINALSVIKAAIGGLDKVVRCVRSVGYVSSAPDFTAQPKVLNGASDLLRDVFGEAGRHARAAVGVNVLPLNSPVEIEFVFEVRG